MKPNRAIGSSAGAAMNRAYDALLPESERLLGDRLAYELLSPALRRVTRMLFVPVLGKAVLNLRERQVPGVLTSILLRARYMDDALTATLVQGLEQVVILGAGMDSRAYRLEGIEKTQVFEVDHPAAQAVKKERLQAVLGALPSHVTFVPIDFDQQSLEQGMAHSGFRKQGRTFFIWEGVTQYITAQAVDATLHFIAETAPGSQAAFTYIKRQVIEGTSEVPGDRRMVALTRRAGVPWIFGIHPHELSDFLAARGLALIEDVGEAEFRARYFQPQGVEKSIYHGERVALASVGHV